MSQSSQIKSLAKQYFDEVKEIREHLHQHPELSFEEYNTSEYLKKKLTDWGISIDKTWVKTGFTVVIEGNKKGPTVALRADLDALPIQEKNNTSYKSKNEGIMHACGHDVHSACLMGALKILNETKDSWGGKLVAIFQAGEEKLPGGASLMIKEGLIDTYKPDKIIAQHVYPEFEVGNIGFKAGMYMASADEIYLTVKGKGGHAALPHKNIDPVVIAANLIVELQQLNSRFCPPTIPMVLSFGKIEGLGATNVIPNEVKIAGTLRMMNEEWRFKVHNQLKQICKNTSEAFGGACEVDIKIGYPYLENNPELTEFCKLSAIEYLGKSAVHELDLRMTAEDFSFFSQHANVCFYRLGVGNAEKGITHSVHHPEFDIDEKSLEIGCGLFAHLAIQNLA